MTAHVLAGGQPPSGPVTVLLVAVVALLAGSLADREAGLAGLLAGALAVQAGVHLALLDPGAGHSGPGPLMLAGHLAAVAALACWLRGAEAARWRTRGLTAGRVGAVLALLEPAPAQPAVRSRTLPVGRRPARGRMPVLLLPARRGPPLLHG